MLVYEHEVFKFQFTLDKIYIKSYAEKYLFNKATIVGDIITSVINIINNRSVDILLKINVIEYVR